MKYSLVILSLTIVFVVACKEATTKVTHPVEKDVVKDFKKIDQLDWLIGEWVNETDEEYSKETWKQLNDSTITGFSYTQIAQDTVFAETLVLQQNIRAVSLTVVAFGQNDDAPVTFNMVANEDNEHTFENLAHDFPQRIVYTQPSKDAIHAWVEGEIEGELKKIDFYFKRQ